MIDFGDFINSQRGNVGFPRRKKKLIDIISNSPISLHKIRRKKKKKQDNNNERSTSVEEAKAKVRAIIENGKKCRQKKKSKKDD